MKLCVYLYSSHIKYVLLFKYLTELTSIKSEINCMYQRSIHSYLTSAYNVAGHLFPSQFLSHKFDLG